MSLRRFYFTSPREREGPPSSSRHYLYLLEKDNKRVQTMIVVDGIIKYLPVKQPHEFRYDYERLTKINERRLVTNAGNKVY